MRIWWSSINCRFAVELWKLWDEQRNICSNIRLLSYPKRINTTFKIWIYSQENLNIQTILAQTVYIYTKYLPSRCIWEIFFQYLKKCWGGWKFWNWWKNFEGKGAFFEIIFKNLVIPFKVLKEKCKMLKKIKNL